MECDVKDRARQIVSIDNCTADSVQAEQKQSLAFELRSRIQISNKNCIKTVRSEWLWGFLSGEFPGFFMILSGKEGCSPYACPESHWFRITLQQNNRFFRAHCEWIKWELRSYQCLLIAEKCSTRTQSELRFTDQVNTSNSHKVMRSWNAIVLVDSIFMTALAVMSVSNADLAAVRVVEALNVVREEV